MKEKIFGFWLLIKFNSGKKTIKRLSCKKST